MYHYEYWQSIVSNCVNIKHISHITLNKTVPGMFINSLHAYLGWLQIKSHNSRMLPFFSSKCCDFSPCRLLCSRLLRVKVLTLSTRSLVLPCIPFSTFFKILTFQKLFQETLKQYWACLYFIIFDAFLTVILNIVTNFQKSDVFEKFA